MMNSEREYGFVVQRGLEGVVLCIVYWLGRRLIESRLWVVVLKTELVFVGG